jgi:hypothetical protein
MSIGSVEPEYFLDEPDIETRINWFLTTVTDESTQAGLPDGLFSNQKSKFG